MATIVAFTRCQISDKFLEKLNQKITECAEKRKESIEPITDDNIKCLDFNEENNLTVFYGEDKVFNFDLRVL